MATATVEVKTYDGKLREAKQIGIYAETDQKGKIFYKTEIQNSNMKSAVSFVYDMDEAIEEFIKMVRWILEEQTRKLEEARDR